MKAVVASLFGLAIALSEFTTVSSIQCYSCRATASNEIEANIDCLETANLEDCNDFYQYYSQVEDPKGADQSLDGAFDDYDLLSLGGGDEKPADRKRERNRGDGNKRNKRESGGGKGTAGKGKKEETFEGLYDYKNSDEYQQNTNGERSNMSADESGSQNKLPTDPEHFCYSATKKNGWESYTVEKGCKKISYCRAHEENLHEWTLAWNFCCEKSRCNAKLVKDKPQRIFAMGCRRTDDCIQGHTTRHVCSEMFQNCPKVSIGVMKMECRVKQKKSGTPVNKGVVGSSYFNQFKEKKCLCAKGYYPRGPICSSSSKAELQMTTAVLLVAASYLHLD